MYRALLLSQIFLLITAYTFALTAIQPPESPKICVIGAGLAGLTTAYRLEQLGYSVEIYEARHRPGGRVCTAYFDNGYMELGAQNLYDGGDSLNLLKLVQEFGLEIQVEKFTWLHSSVVLQKKLYPLVEILKELQEPNEALLNALQERVNQVDSLGHLIDPIFEGKTLARQLFELLMRGYEGSSTYLLAPEYLNLSFWRFYSTLYDMVHSRSQGPISQVGMLVGGNSCLIEALVDHLKSKIHYDCPLRKIARTPQGRFEIVLDGKGIVETDYLILTLPCTTLRHVAIQSGIIPNDQATAIQTLQYGTNAKILLPVQLEQHVARSSFTDDYVCWINSSQSIFTWYYGADNGIFDSSSLKVLAEQVQRGLPAFYLMTPGVKFPCGIAPVSMKDELKAHYSTPVGVSWTNEEFSKGSYSNYGTNQFAFFEEEHEELGETVRNVFRSIEGQIFFAGEHTAVDNPATMEGAVESGEKAARMVHRALQSKE